MPIYSHGLSSPVKLHITHVDAQSYNRVVRARREIETPRNHPIRPTARDIRVYGEIEDQISQILNRYYREVDISEFSSDYLILN